MARLPRLVVPGQLHLLLQRAPAGQVVFVDDTDYAAYRAALGPAARDHGVAVHAYALLPAQVLLLVTPAGAQGPSRMLQAVGRRFGADYNRRHARTGALWDGRFRATVVDPAYLLEATRYVETAPVRHGGAPSATEYAWSSALHHAGGRVDPHIIEHRGHWSLGNTPFEREATYRRLLEQPLSPSLLARLDDAAQKGWALGEAPFLKRLAGEAPRRIAPLSRGRPKHADKTVPHSNRPSKPAI